LSCLRVETGGRLHLAYCRSQSLLSSRICVSSRFSSRERTARWFRSTTNPQTRIVDPGLILPCELQFNTQINGFYFQRFTIPYTTKCAGKCFTKEEVIFPRRSGPSSSAAGQKPLANPAQPIDSADRQGLSFPPISLKKREGWGRRSIRLELPGGGTRVCAIFLERNRARGERGIPRRWGGAPGSKRRGALLRMRRVGGRSCRAGRGSDYRVQSQGGLG